MRKFKLDFNTRVDIYFENISYKTIIQDVQKDSFSISIPVANGEYLTLKNGEKIELFNYTESCQVYKLTCKVKAKTEDNNIPLYKLELPMEIKKIQRRDFVRVNMLQPVRYSILNNPLNTMNTAILLDLSGGGLRIKIKENLNYGDRIKVELRLEGMNIEVKGEIVRIEKSDDSRYIYGLRFLELENNIRETIIRNVFTIMRKQRELV